MTGAHRAEERGGFSDMAYRLAALADRGTVATGSAAEQWGALFARLAGHLAENAPVPLSLVLSSRFGAHAHLSRQRDLDDWAVRLRVPVRPAVIGLDGYRELVTEWRGLPLRMWTRGLGDEPAPPPEPGRWAELWERLRQCVRRKADA